MLSKRLWHDVASERTPSGQEQVSTDRGEAPWGNAALAEDMESEGGSGGLLGWLSSGRGDQESAEPEVCEPSSRVVEGAGGYTYEQHPDGSVRILAGPTGVGSQLESGAAWEAITAEIGPHPGCAVGEEAQAEAEAVGEETGLLDIPMSLATGDIEWIQERVDALADRVQSGEEIAGPDREFLEDLYWWVGAGGYGVGMPEAAKLQTHYMSGDGEALEIDSGLYEGSVIVQYAMAEMKRVMEADLREGGAVRNGGVLSSTEVLGRTNFGDADRMGEIKAGGYLMAEQDNDRLKYANNRFALEATVQQRQGWLPWQADEYLEIEWRVNDRWDFNSYKEQQSKGRNDWTEIPLPAGPKLILPDGLSAWLVEAELAVAFDYHSSWTEQWEMSP